MSFKKEKKNLLRFLAEGKSMINIRKNMDLGIIRMNRKRCIGKVCLIEMSNKFNNTIRHLHPTNAAKLPLCTKIPNSSLVEYSCPCLKDLLNTDNLLSHLQISNYNPLTGGHL